MHTRRAIGIISIIGIIVLASWLALRSCAPPPQISELPPTAARELFHASKPIQVRVVDPRVVTAPDVTAQDTAVADAGTADLHEDTSWIEFELRQLLSRARMRVAPLGETGPEIDTAGNYTLRILLGEQVDLTLIAPDGVIEREDSIQRKERTGLATLSSIAARLPAFLDAGHARRDWIALLGTADSKALDAYKDAAFPILGTDGQGFTRPPRQRPTRTIERLEALTRRHPDFGRAWAALAAGYLSQGGEDERSLALLAESSAQRALALDDALADAHAVLGLVHLRRGEWVAAHERFDRALALDVNNAPALEGLACLFVDAGHYAAARPTALRALALQPRNIGARECLAYSLPQPLAADTPVETLAETPTGNPADVPASTAQAPNQAHDQVSNAAPPDAHAAAAGRAGTNAAQAHATRPESAPATAVPAPGNAALPAEAAVAAPVAQARALAAILEGDLPAARTLLRDSLSSREFNAWAAPLLKAAAQKRHVPDALQAITRAANEQRMDAATEILCGTALRQGEFVFNRITRLQRQGEHVPLRVLWMPQTAFLRRNRSFEKVIGTTGLNRYWQEQGAPDVCATESGLSVCKLRTAAGTRR